MLLGFLAYSVSCVSLPPRNSRLTLNKNSTTCHEQTIGVDYFKSRKEHRLIRKVEEQVFYSREIGGSGAFLISREIGSAFYSREIESTIYSRKLGSDFHSRNFGSTIYSRKLRSTFIPGNWGALFVPGKFGSTLYSRKSGSAFTPGNSGTLYSGKLEHSSTLLGCFFSSTSFKYLAIWLLHITSML